MGPLVPQPSPPSAPGIEPITGSKMRLQLSVIDGPNAGWTLEVRKNRVVIGRGRADLRLQDPRVAFHHCILEIVGDRFVLRELEGATGVWVNGQRVSRARLESMDEIWIGGTRLRFTALPVVSSDQPAGAAPVRPPMPSPIPSPGEAGEAAAAGATEVRRELTVFLEILSGTGAGSVFDIARPGSYDIGRRTGPIALEDPRCSRRHARIDVLGPGEYQLFDLASTEGTFLNEMRISRARLKHLDIIQVGGTHLRFSCAEAKEGASSEEVGGASPGTP